MGLSPVLGKWYRTALFLISCLAAAVIHGCAGLPDIDRFPSVQQEDRTPEIMGIREPFSREKAREAIDDLQRQAGPTDILTHHTVFVETLSQSPLTAGNKVTILRNGPEALAAMTDTIRKAKDHVHLEVFIFRNDEVGRPLADLLIEKQRQGVDVRVIYDGFGSRKTPEPFFARMRRAGIELYEFNPFNLLDLAGQSKFYNRDHRKIIVVDGKTAFTGGINFYQVYAEDPYSQSGDTDSGQVFWRDTQIQIQGPAVAQFQKLFLETWVSGKQRIPLQAGLFPFPEKKGGTLVRVISGFPGQRIPHIYATFVSAIRNARKTIKISQAYFIPDDHLMDALSSAVQKGVEVQVIVPGKSDFWMPVYAGRALYSRLLQAGVRLHEMKGAVLHSKTAVIDGVWSMVGSSNIDALSFLHNTEASAVILDAGFAREMELMFETDLSRSEEIMPAQWRQRPWIHRIMEKVAQLFEYWL